MPARLLALLLILAPLPAAAEIVVGFVGTMTGGGATIGRDALDGFHLALKHLGGRLGGVEAVVRVGDDKRRAELAGQQAERMARQEKAAFVVFAGAPSATPAALAPVAGAGAFLVGLNGGPARLAGAACDQNLFSLAGADDEVHRVAGQYLRQREFRRVAIVGGHGEEARAAGGAFRRAFGAELAAEIYAAPGQMSYTADIARLRALGVEAVYLLHTGGMGVSFLKQFAAHAAEPDIPVFGPFTTFDRSTLLAAGDAALGTFSFAPWSEDIDNPANRRVVVEFETEYGRPASVHAARGYEAAMLIDAALRVTGGVVEDRAALRAALRRVEWAALRGPFRFAGNHFPADAYYLREAVRDARGRPANAIRLTLPHPPPEASGGTCGMVWEEPAPPPRRR